MPFREPCGSLRQSKKERLMIELACMLYAQNLLSSGKAAQLAGMNRQRFGEELEKLGNIPRHYDEQCLAEDLMAMQVW